MIATLSRPSKKVEDTDISSFFSEWYVKSQQVSKPALQNFLCIFQWFFN